MPIVKKLAVSLAVAGSGVVVLLLGGVMFNGTVSAMTSKTPRVDPTTARAAKLVAEGRNVFRNDTFGDEAV